MNQKARVLIFYKNRWTFQIKFQTLQFNDNFLIKFGTDSQQFLHNPLDPAKTLLANYQI